VYGENVVTSLCGVLDAVYMPESLYNKIKDEINKEVVFTIDRHWDSPVEAYMWVWEKYGDKFSDTTIFHIPSMREESGHNARACRDYAVMSRAFVFFSHGVECIEDYEFYMSLFARGAANSSIFGFAGGCFPEFDMFRTAGQFAKFWTYGFSTPNMSFLNSLEAGELKQKDVSEPAELKEGTVYVCFNMSEGDNLSWDYHIWAKNFQNEKARAATPKGYSICGALYYIAPALVEYYYDIATENDYFFLDGGSVSNIGSPDNYGMYYKGRDEIRNTMLELLNSLCEKMDIEHLRVLENVSDDTVKLIAQKAPAVKAVLSSYGNLVYNIGGSNGDYKKAVNSIDGIMRLRCQHTTFAGDLEPQLANTLKRVRDKEKPIFAEVFVYTNPLINNIGILEQYVGQLKKSGREIEVVRLDEFVRLYNDYEKMR